MLDNPITFEQPLNELYRVSLRLEHLFNKITDNINLPSTWASRITLTALLELVNLTDRPDLKAKLSKSLTAQAEKLTALKDSPQVNLNLLNSLLDDLDEIIDRLYLVDGKLGQNLRDNDFLSGIRSHLNNPGGPCDFSLPAYQLWLHQPATNRTHDLQNWFSDIDLLYRAVSAQLKLTRESKQSTRCLAEQGFYLQNLDPQQQGELIRVIVPAHLKVYPEISVGRHRISIRFYQENTENRSQQTDQDIEFYLAYCTS